MWPHLDGLRNGGVAPLILILFCKLKWAVKFTDRPVQPRERVHGTNFVGEWLGSRAGVDDLEKSYLPIPGMEPRFIGWLIFSLVPTDYAVLIPFNTFTVVEFYNHFAGTCCLHPHSRSILLTCVSCRFVIRLRNLRMWVVKMWGHLSDFTEHLLKQLCLEARLCWLDS